MTITIPLKLKKEIKSLLKKINISEEDFILNAILYYFEIIKKQSAFRNELKRWEIVSDIDFLNFENKINEKRRYLSRKS